jgi:hypothetical protein
MVTYQTTKKKKKKKKKEAHCCTYIAQLREIYVQQWAALVITCRTIYSVFCSMLRMNNNTPSPRTRHITFLGKS